MFFRLLPWEYATRNLLRRPVRTFLTLLSLAAVILMVFVVVGFIRGLEQSLAVSGDADTAVVFGLGMGENLEYSSIEMSTGDLISASVVGIQERYGQKYVSPELQSCYASGTLHSGSTDFVELSRVELAQVGLLFGNSTPLIVHRPVGLRSRCAPARLRCIALNSRWRQPEKLVRLCRLARIMHSK
jgi:hypothetical protein